MAKKPTYEELEQRVKGLKEEASELKRAKKALRESEKEGRTLIDVTSEGYWLIDPERKTLDVNQSLCNILGYSREEIIGKSPFDFVDDENRKVFKSQMAQIEDTTHRTYEVVLKNKSGEDVYTHFSATTILDESGAVEGAFAFITDITPRKRAEQRVNHLNAVLRSIRNVNKLITKQKDPDKLLQGACNNLVETRGYDNTWIVLLDESRRALKTAEAGVGEAFLSMVELLHRGELTDCARRALTQMGVVVTEDPFSMCADCPLARSYAGKGAMTTRLEHEGRLYGLLSVSVSKDFAVDEEEQSLFQQVAGDIAFALHGIEMEEAGKRAEEALRQREAALETRKNELEEVNTALRVLLKQREGDKAKLEERVLSNVKRRVLPYVEKLKRGGLHAQQMACLTPLESNLNDLVSPFGLKLSSKCFQLTPSEIEIAHFVKDGQHTKDIAEMLNLSTRTVEFHRANIRKKLGIKNVRTSLRSHLESLE